MTATEKRGAITIEDQATAARAFLWDSYTGPVRNGWFIPSECTYVKPDSVGIKVHPKLRGDKS